MPRIPGTSHSQTTFLRAFRSSPSGPPPSAWPSPAILRRWLRSPAFRAALASLQETLRLQSDFQLTGAAHAALQSLAPSTPGAAAPDSPQLLQSLLRLSHLRQRFPTNPTSGPASAPVSAVQSDPAPSSPRKSKTETSLATFYPATPPAPLTPKRDPQNPNPQKPSTFSETAGGEVSITLPSLGEGFGGVQHFQALQQRFAPVARRLCYFPPLATLPTHPPTNPDDDAYYRLLHNPNSLLQYMLTLQEPDGAPTNRYHYILLHLPPHVLEHARSYINDPLSTPLPLPTSRPPKTAAPTSPDHSDDPNPPHSEPDFPTPSLTYPPRAAKAPTSSPVTISKY